MLLQVFALQHRERTIPFCIYSTDRKDYYLSEENICGIHPLTGEQFYSLDRNVLEKLLFLWYDQ